VSVTAVDLGHARRAGRWRSTVKREPQVYGVSCG